MRRLVRLRVLPLGSALLALSVAGLGGCGQNSMLTQGQLQKTQQEQIALQRQSEQLQSRLNTLDRDHQELNTLLAQSRQQTQMVEDQLAMVRNELTDVTAQLAKARQERDVSDSRVKAMTASLQRQGGGVTITPNRSIQAELPAVSLPGIEVRRDGDVVRIVLPAERLFEPGTARLRAGAPKLVTYVAGELVRVYPRHRIGVEGHTSDAAGASEQTLAWASAVHQVLASQTQLLPSQLFVTGHGANHPVYSNGSLDGQERNRRVELVVYPDVVTR
ncbi:MAG: OmpA family protein [Pirellulales bacterium]|nr:OmpA family protein [Pirellulales bacterium]